ncbi:biotin-dependent carboxyltransferase family protein [Coprothermobacter platensis]|uniref:5-oxoprolinase subunit C family protein n=1 Tax=Coprothermobacter platensis TaxID=108819 RepID=UPI00036DB3CF|nr:biotin-dependent carboxyltransferase family protein [Coprothermobacter platensis]
MATAFEVLSPGFLTTVQDRGRLTYRRIGMPTAGALDQYSFRIANMLVGNNPLAACLETTYIGPTLRVLCNTVIALTGALCDAAINGKPMAQWKAIKVHSGDIISIGQALNGVRSYLSVACGIDVPLIMESRSTFIRGKIGGIEGRALKKGDEIGIFTSSDLEPCDSNAIPEPYKPTWSSDITLRVILGPQDNHFSENGLATFFNSTYTITEESDRMGYRLNGNGIAYVSWEAGQIISDPIPLGAVQIPPNGQPIITLMDAQTTGGYPKIATICTADLSLIAQGKPGDKVHFTAIGNDEAVKSLREQEQKISILGTMMKSHPQEDGQYFHVMVNGLPFDVWVKPE